MCTKLYIVKEMKETLLTNHVWALVYSTKHKGFRFLLKMWKLEQIRQAQAFMSPLVEPSSSHSSACIDISTSNYVNFSLSSSFEVELPVTWVTHTFVMTTITKLSTTVIQLVVEKIRKERYSHFLRPKFISSNFCIVENRYNKECKMVLG